MNKWIKRILNVLIILGILGLSGCLTSPLAADITALEGATGYIGKEDIKWGTGQPTDTFTVTTYDGGSATLTKVPDPDAADESIIKGVWYVAAMAGDHGNAALTGSLAWVIATLAGDPATVILPGDQTYQISTNLTVPATVCLVMHRGAEFSVDNTKTLTINGTFEAGLYQVFSGAGSVKFGSLVTEVYPEWWGIDGVADEVQLDIADTALTDGTIILNRNDSYAIDDDLIIDNALWIKKGAVLNIAITKTLTINGPFEAGLYQTFNGTGVTFGEDVCTEIHPEWWGIDGTADEVQIQQAIESASGLEGATIKLLPKDYNTVATITVNRDRINIVGSGEHATRIMFAPTADDVCMEWDEGGTMISQCTIRDLSFYTDDTTLNKVAMRLEDIDIFEMKNVQISGSDANGWTGGTESIGLQIQGRNIGSIQNINIFADVPISIEDNPNSTIDIDHFNFNNLYLTAKNDSTTPCVRVADGVNLQNVTFDGVQAWIFGSYGFYWNDTTTTSTSLSLSFNNVRLEQSTDTTGYMFYISHNTYLQNLSFHNIFGTEKLNGYYLRNILNTCIKNSVFTNNVAGIALNIDLSVRNLKLNSNYWQTGTTFTSSDQTLISGTVQQQGPLPTNAIYQATDATYNPEPHFLTDAPISGTIKTLLDQGKAEIAQDTFVGYAFIASSSSYPAIYAINGVNASVTEVNDPGTLYEPTEDNDTTTNIYWDAGNVRYEINNEEGASRDYYITLIGRTR